jgi:hypothetical protein
VFLPRAVKSKSLFYLRISIGNTTQNYRGKLYILYLKIYNGFIYILFSKIHSRRWSKLPSEIRISCVKEQLIFSNITLVCTAWVFHLTWCFYWLPAFKSIAKYITSLRLHTGGKRPLRCHETRNVATNVDCKILKTSKLQHSCIQPLNLVPDA